MGEGSAEGADGAALASGSARAELRPVPWLLKAGLRPEEAATQDENWCGVLQVRGQAGGRGPARRTGACAGAGRQGCRPALAKSITPSSGQRTDLEVGACRMGGPRGGARPTSVQSARLLPSPHRLGPARARP